MRCATFNINYSRRAVDTPFEISKRLDQICALLHDGEYDVICLQEIHDSVCNLEDRFYRYRFFWMRHSSRGGCCRNAVLISKKVLKQDEFVIINKPGFTHVYLGEEHIIECITIVEVLDRFAIVNVHAPMAQEIRLKVSQVVGNLTSRFDRVLVLGDFNAFGDCLKREEQIKTLLDSGLQLHEPDRPTFRPYPYDKFVSRGPRKPLDLVFSRGFAVSDLEVIGDKSTIPEDTTVEGHYFISDHFLVRFSCHLE